MKKIVFKAAGFLAPFLILTSAAITLTRCQPGGQNRYTDNKFKLGCNNRSR